VTITDIENEPNQQKRIQALRAELEKLGGASSSIEDMPADLEEEFLKQVLAYETAESITLSQWLANAGMQVPSPKTLDEPGLSVKLMEIIQRMASLGAYLLHTNHLSDRELYQYLYNDALREEATLFPENPGYAYMIDLTGSGSDEDNQIYLKYYADEEWRKRWAEDWPDDPIPEHEDPPYDRDATLPRSPFG
jgi:hypothetical protein